MTSNAVGARDASTSSWIMSCESAARPGMSRGGAHAKTTPESAAKSKRACITLLPSRGYCDDAAHVVRSVLRIRLRNAIHTDHGDLRRRNVRETAYWPELLIVEIHGRVRIGLTPIEARLTTIGQEVRSELVDDLVRIRSPRCDDLVLADYL